MIYLLAFGAMALSDVFGAARIRYIAKGHTLWGALAAMLSMLAWLASGGIASGELVVQHFSLHSLGVGACTCAGAFVGNVIGSESTDHVEEADEESDGA